MQHAQEYLAKVLPWPQDGDPPAYINIHWTIDKLHPKTGKPIWTGRAVRSVQEATNTVNWALSLPETKDIYVCMSSQRQADQRIAKVSKHPYLFPIRGQANAVALKSLFMDIDAKGKDKDSYDTLAEALVAFRWFIKDIGLPNPNVVVKTGGGLHVYWTFERPIPVQEWQPLSDALAAAARHYDFRCDTGCTVDSARVLRIPDTFNCKLGIRRPVVLAGGHTAGDYLLARLEKSLGPYKGITPKVTSAAAPTPKWDLSAFPPLPPINDKDKLSSGFVEEKTNLKNIIPVCPFLKEAVTTGGKDFGNPLWNLTTLIATMTEGGRLDAHVMARSHATYNKGDTDALFERKERERKEKGLGWPACRTIHNNGFKGCAGCVHLATDRSALYAAASVLTQTSNAAPGAGSGSAASAGSNIGIRDLPTGYSRRPDGVVCQIIINEDGTNSDVPICNYPLFDPTIQIHPECVLNFSTTVETGKTREITASASILTENAPMRRCMAEKGVALKPNEATRMVEFFMSWIKTLQAHKEYIVSADAFGWSTGSKGIEGFVYGGNLWMANGGKRQAAAPDKVLARRYTPRGTNMDPWVAAAKLITDQKRPALDAIVASAFAAPLIKFCYEPGVLMSTYSTKSGIGKTSALKVAQAVWGDPISGIQALDDTTNSLFRKISAIRNLPMYWDELKSEKDTERFVNIVFKLTGQKEKDRLNQNSTMKDSGSWNTLLVSAANDSIMQFVVQHSKQTTAGINRVFEYEVPAASSNIGQIDQADASRILGKLDDNYGYVGLAYASYLGSNHAAVSKDVESFYKSIGNELSTTNEERYWRVMVCCLLKGAEYSNKLKFTNIDEQALKDFLIKVVGDLRLEKNNTSVDLEKAINVSEIVTRFIADQSARHLITTDKINRAVGAPAANAIKVKTDVSRLENITVHVATDDKIVRISKPDLEEWLRKNGYSSAAVVQAVMDRYSAASIQSRMASGTSKAGHGKQRMIEIDYAKNPDLDPEM